MDWVSSQMHPLYCRRHVYYADKIGAGLGGGGGGGGGLGVQSNASPINL